MLDQKKLISYGFLAIPLAFVIIYKMTSSNNLSKDLSNSKDLPEAQPFLMGENTVPTVEAKIADGDYNGSIPEATLLSRGGRRKTKKHGKSKKNRKTKTKRK